MNGDTGGIGSDQSAGLAKLVNFFVKGTLDVKALHDYFDDPVAGRKVFEVIIEVTCGNPFDNILCIDRGRVAFDGSLQRVVYYFVAKGFFVGFFGFVWNDIEQQDLYTYAGKMAGNS